MKRLMILFLVVTLIVSLNLQSTLAAVDLTVSAAFNSANDQVTITGSISSGAGKMVTVEVQDPSGGIDYIDMTTSGDAGSYVFRYIIKNKVNGIYTVKVYGAEAAEIKTTTFTVSTVPPTPIPLPVNSEPTINVLEPISGASYNAPASITIKADAADSDGTVAKVEFYNGTVKLGEVTDAPYEYVWSNVAAGQYVIKAVAIDNEGATATSGTVNVTVNQVSGGVSSGGANSDDINQSPVIIPSKPVVPQNTSKIIPEVELEQATNTAKSVIGIETLNNALANAEVDAKGIKTVVVEVPKTEGATAYAQQLPASALTSTDNKHRVAVVTEFASIQIPGNVLKSAKLGTANDIVFNVAAADKTSLADSVKAQVDNRPAIELYFTVDGKRIEYKNPNSPVLVTVPYDPTAEELKNSEHIVVWHIDAEGKIVPVPTGKYDAASGKVVFTTTYLGQYAVSYVFKTFDDIAGYEWAKAQIEAMASKGIVNGTGEKTFTPDANITRADFTILLVKSLGLTAEIDSNFSDVSTANYYYEAVGIARKLGIINGQGDNKFNPEEGISRQDMIVITARAMRWAEKMASTDSTVDLEKYTDKSLVAEYAAADVSALVKEGLIKGNGEAINPLGNTTRAEAAVLMHRVYNK